MKTLENIKCTYAGQVQQFDKEMTFETFTYKIENDFAEVQEGTAMLSEVASETVGYLRDNETGRLFRLDLEEDNATLTFKSYERFIHVCAEKNFFSISTNHKLKAGTQVYLRGVLETVAVDVAGSIVRFKNGGSASVHDCYQLVEEVAEVKPEPSTPDYVALVAEHQQDNQMRHSQQLSWGLEAEVYYEAKDLEIEWVKFSTTVDPSTFASGSYDETIINTAIEKVETLMGIAEVLSRSGAKTLTIETNADNSGNVFVVLRAVNLINYDISSTQFVMNVGKAQDTYTAQVTRITIKHLLETLFNSKLVTL